MKLNGQKIHWIIHQKKKGIATSEIAKDMRISRRRVQQIWKYYLATGIEPVLGSNIGRPKKPFNTHEDQIVKEAYNRFRFGARMLEVAIRKSYKTCISHNRIHMYLKIEGLAHENPDKKNQRNSDRYESEHSLSVGYIDWNKVNGSDIKVCVILDDASRMILAGGEFTGINIENSKKIVDQLIEKYWWLCPMRELILDHGDEFGAYKVSEDGKWDSDFLRYLEKHGIEPILASAKRGLINKKIVRFFREYKRHRNIFSSFEEFAEWYNNRPHGSLEFKRLETPKQAFYRKMPQEAYFRIGHRLFGL